MLYLLAGLLLFITNHSIRLVAPGWRQSFIDNFGSNTWKALYSLFSLLGLALIIYGYAATRTAPQFLWAPPLWTRHAALVFTWLAFILLAAASIRDNHFKQWLGHPMYAGIKLWAFAHLMANGRAGDVLLFGSFLVWAIVGFSLSRRRDRRDGLRYPAGNIVRSMYTLGAGTIAWLVFTFWLHRLLIGVAPLVM